MWERWQKDRQPDEHTMRLREGIAFMREMLMTHDLKETSHPIVVLREAVKQRAYQIDPEAWESYSGKEKYLKQQLDRRRVAALRKAEDELGNWRKPI